MDGLDWTLISRYLEGSCTQAEWDAVEQWASQNPLHRSELEQLQRAWAAAAQIPPGRKVDEMWDKLATRMRAPSLNIADRPRTPSARVLSLSVRQPSPRRRIAAIAAVLLAVVSLGGAWYVLNLERTVPLATAPTIREYVTTRGQRATIQLSDGSHLTLAPESRLRIPSDFGIAAREIALDGEAFIDVVHDAARPFRVRIKEAIAEDLGTRFDIRSYAEDSTVAVAVEAGSVALGRSAPTVAASARAAPGPRAPEGIVLRRGDLGTLGSDGRVTTTSSRSDFMSAWTKGKLIFVRSPLTDVARTIGRWYDLDVQVEGPALATSTVTATFSVQSPNEMLQILGFAVDARVKRSGRVVRLIANR